MPIATLTAKGQVVIPAKIRERYSLTPGTQIEFVDNGSSVELKVRRRVLTVDAASGYGMLQADPAKKSAKRLSDFDAASLIGGRDK